MWISYFKFEKNANNFLQLGFTPLYAYGVQVRLTKFHPNSKIQGENLYGIYTFSALRGGNNILMRDCIKIDDESALWSVSEVAFADYSLWKPRLDELTILFTETQNLMNIIT